MVLKTLIKSIFITVVLFLFCIAMVVGIGFVYLSGTGLVMIIQQMNTVMPMEQIFLFFSSMVISAPFTTFVLRAIDSIQAKEQLLAVGAEV